MNKSLPYPVNLGMKASLYLGDCREVLPALDQKVDMIIADIPFGTTRNKWDKPIPADEMWKAIETVRADRTPVLIHAQAPFDKVVATGNLSDFKYEWIWEKTKATGHLNAKKMPLKAHENVLVFYRKLPVYNPQKTTGHKPVNSYTKHGGDGPNYGKTKVGVSGGGNTDRYPRSILKFAADTQKSSLHPTQKPVSLISYMIRTYTNPGDTVLDFSMGSGTTGIACLQTDRRFIGVELEQEYFETACRRMTSEHEKQTAA